MITAFLRRIPFDSLNPQIKSLNYLNNVMAKIEANNAGFQEAVMLNRDGFVTECTGENIFIVKDDCLYTPDTSNEVLNGITRNIVFELAKRNRIKHRLKSFMSLPIFLFLSYFHLKQLCF